MPLRNVKPAIPQQPAQHGNPAGGFNRRLHRLVMAGTAAAVHDNRGNTYARLQLLEAQYYCRRTAAHAADIEHQQYRAVCQDGDLGG